jgi:hypothetical protein
MGSSFMSQIPTVLDLRQQITPRTCSTWARYLVSRVSSFTNTSEFPQQCGPTPDGCCVSKARL